MVEMLIRQNEIRKVYKFTCLAIHDYKAEQLSHRYNRTRFIWVKIPRFIKIADRLLSFIIKKILRKGMVHSLGFLFQIIYFTINISFVLKKDEWDLVVFENSIPALLSLNLFSNLKSYESKFYMHIHSVPKKYYGTENILFKSRGLICVSHYVSSEIQRKLSSMIDKTRIGVMFNCVDAQIFKPGYLDPKIS